ncbi:MAG: putative C-S lyase [Clostridiales bacterium]|nr:putative C-S lyase [Clostridiales bacterium]
MELNREFFDEVIDRSGTASEKWDARKEVFGRADVLPLWVADMDFRCAPEIVRAIEERARHPIYGYTANISENRAAEAAWLRRRFGLDVDPDWILTSPSVVDSMLYSIEAFTSPGERVLIQPPVYGPFRETVKRLGRLVEESPLVDAPDGYRMDFEGLESAFASGVKFMFLCSPHNPVGRVWTRAELERLFGLADRFGAVIVSDEIHASFAFSPHRHTPCLSLSSRSVMLTSATKAFNLAGLRQSSAVVSDPELRKKLKTAIRRFNGDRPNLFAMAAQRAAYELGDEWLDKCLDYIRENRDFAEAFIGANLPEIAVHPLEGTYLMWLDTRKTGVRHGELFRRLVDAGVGLNDGLFFGEQGRGYFRLNLAAPRANIERGLLCVERALSK